MYTHPITISRGTLGIPCVKQLSRICIDPIFHPQWLPTLQKMTCYFDNCICYQNCNCDMVLRDDAMLVPCDSHLWATWAMQLLSGPASSQVALCN